MPDCYQCKYRQNIPGDCHSSCNAPVVSQETKIKVMLMVTNGLDQIVTDVTGLSFEKYAISNGWCNFPLNYDPIWVSGDCKLKKLSEDLELQIIEKKSQEQGS